MTEPGRGGFAALDPCVHCGFCLPACPTYLASGDESDSPRGRILLMRALERGDLPPTDQSLAHHLDVCLGCRGCEAACPSGVQFGEGLEAARDELVRHNGLPLRTRSVLNVFSRRWAWRAAFGIGRWIRRSGAAGRFAGPGRFGFLAGMLEATRPVAGQAGSAADRSPPTRGTVALFRGCVMEGLFDHVHQATRRTLEANGYQVIECGGQVCCGALHAHAGDREGAQALGRANLGALAGRADYVVVNSAGCGAQLKALGSLLGTDNAGKLAASVRDVTELLAAAGPRRGAAIGREVCYDAPCHLQHAQKVHAEVLQVLGAIDGVTPRLLPGFDRCCGAAGIYGVLHPEMSRAVLDDKVAGILAADPAPDVVVTGNPGCLMQIGAGLIAAGSTTVVAHPVELLDWSYRNAGYYP